MNRLIFTRLRDRNAAVLASEHRVLQIEFEAEDAASQVGTIYVGKVRNVVKNLNAAFVEYRPGINGYYSLTDNPVHRFADGRYVSAPLKSGDEILVQISRAAVKTKDAVLTGELSLTGQLAAVSLKERSLGISAKIRDREWRNRFREQWESIGSPPCGVIIRTNAYGVDFDQIFSEISLLYGKLTEIVSGAAFKTSFSILHSPDSFAITVARNVRLELTEEIVTDLPSVYGELSASGLFPSRESGTPKLRLYTDSYPLAALYHLETALERALSKTVWLKSGGYLIIEPTEAMTVIDVNTGKNIEKKSASEIYFKTNLEAADEIAAQLRLRNLSGIIIIDFIDMASAEQKEELLGRLRRLLSEDPIKATLVDMTALGLVEVTRKKIRRPLHEQIPSSKP